MIDIYNYIKDLLEGTVVDHGALDAFVTTILVTVILLAAIGIYYVLNFYVGKILDTFVKRTEIKWDDIMFRPKFMHWCWRCLSVVFCYFTLPDAFCEYPSIANVVWHVMWVVMVMTFAKILIELIKSFFLLAADHENVDSIAEKMRMAEDNGEHFEYQPSHSLKGLQQMISFLIMMLTIILVVSHLVGESPMVIITGLGAFAAVLMLVFKDSILGVVAGVQLTANDMLRPGDWITAPKYGINGIVREVTLATVKVQNWDKTIITVPPYSLISDAFQNWRGMQRSGGRRIKRALNIDMSTVRFVNAEEACELAKESWAKNVEIKAGETVNLTLFRYYLEEEVVKKCPTMLDDMLFMIRELQPTEYGLPVEIYFFTSCTEWKSYERVQSDVLDFVIASLNRFSLRVFQAPSGIDIRQRS